MGRHAYNVSVAWHDPFEHHEERRNGHRFDIDLRISISVTGPEGKGSLVGPGRVVNISLSGVLVATKHALEPGQRATLSLSTALCPDDLCLPEAFVGPAEVVRVRPLDGRLRLAALRFGDELAQNMEFALFMNYLEGIAAVMGPEPV